MAIVGMSSAAPVETNMSKKSLAAARKAAAAPALPSSRGIDPTVTVVTKAAVLDDEGQGKPDKAVYDSEQAVFKDQIDALTLKQNEVKARIAAVSGSGPNQERKVALRATLDSLRSDQARIKGGRGKTLDQVKALQDALTKKIKDLQAAKQKSPFKSVTEVEAQIKNLERNVEGGMMKLVDEKKALNEISNLKKTRKTVESFAATQALIDGDKASIDAIRADLDNPEAKAINEKFNAAKAELDAINKAHDEASKGRDGLYEERNAISEQINAVYTLKKDAMSAFREANNKFYQKQTEDREKRYARQRAEKLEYEDSKRSEINERLLEEAQAPAFEREIEDCGNLIRFFTLRIGGVVAEPTLSNGNGVAGSKLPQLSSARIVDAGLPAGAVALKKKGEDEEFFMGGGSKKGKKGPKKVEEGVMATKKDEKLGLPFGTLSALLSMGIESPIVVSEIQRTIDALESKKKYFTENQARVTKEKIEKVQAKIDKAEEKSKAASGTATPVTVEAPAKTEDAVVEA